MRVGQPTVVLERTEQRGGVNQIPRSRETAGIPAVDVVAKRGEASIAVVTSRVVRHDRILGNHRSGPYLDPAASPSGRRVSGYRDVLQRERSVFVADAAPF